MSDWIEDFVAYTEGLPTPEIFRRWSAITAIAGGLERKVWMQTAQSVLYPNLYTLLVAPPGIGKSQAINPVHKLWYDSKEVIVAPDDMTKASFIDSLTAADKKVILPEHLAQELGIPILDYHALCIALGEFGVLLSQHDLNFLSVFNQIFDAPRVYIERRRHRDEDSEIINPHLTILAGTQPGFLGALLPEEAWNMGFTSRLIMVYSGDAQIVDLFGFRPNPTITYRALLDDFKVICKMIGQMHWTPSCQKAVQAWHRAGCPPVPDHSKLEHYRIRRIMHALKLSAICAISRTKEYLIEEEDFERARTILIDAEMLMPDIFRQMAGKSDKKVLDELHHAMWREFNRTKKYIPEAFIYNFISGHVPTEKVERLIENAVKSNIIARMAGTRAYMPVLQNRHGVE